MTLLPFHTRRTSRFIVRLFSIMLAGLCLSGCGMKPAPRYTPGSQAQFSATHTRMMKVLESYMGVPYLYGGPGRQGIDCSGLVMVAYQRAAGVHLPHRAAKLQEMGNRISRKKLRFGDLVFFNTGSQEGLHTGIFIGNNRFVHASVSRGVMTSDLDENYYKTKYIGARRLLKR